MNIAFFSKDLPLDKPNGVSVQVHRLAQELSNQGNKVTVYTFSPKPTGALYECITLFWRTANKLARKFEPALAFRSINTEQFDIVHYHGDDYLCKGSSKRVRTFYGSALDEALNSRSVQRILYQTLFYLFEKISCNKKGMLVGISSATKKALPRIAAVIPCGVPLELYEPSGQKSTNPTILFVGDLYGRKRGDLLVDVFTKQIVPHFPECELRIVGPQLSIGKNIKYLGKLDETALVKEYQRTWIYCMTSSYEGFGVPAIEAMACETPVVAVSNPGISEIISSEKDGIVCKADELRDSICRLLSDSELRKRLSVQGRKTALQYDMRNVADKYLSIYEELE